MHVYYHVGDNPDFEHGSGGASGGGEGVHMVPLPAQGTRLVQLGAQPPNCIWFGWRGY